METQNQRGPREVLRRRHGLAGWGWGACLAGLLMAVVAPAQNVTYDADREVAVPDYATIRIGQMYSTIAFHTAVGYRYTRSSGAGTDYIYSGDRGRINKDGSDFPMVIALDTRNFIAISRHSSLDFSVRTAYWYYPLDTQDDEWEVTVPDERLDANFTTSYRLTPRLNGVLYDRMEYVTDYVDLRGRIDDYGGRQFTYFQNRFGTTLTSTMTERSTLSLDLSRLDLLVLDNEEDFGDQERYEYQESLTYSRRFYSSVYGGARAKFTQSYYTEETRPDTTQQDYSVFVGGDEGGGIPLTDATMLSLSIGTSVGAADSSGAEESETTTALTGSARLRTQLTKDLAHSLRYVRGLRRGYNTAFEEYSTWGYEVDFNRVGNYIQVYSYYDSVTPTTANLEPYDIWVTGVSVSYPLLTYLTLDGSYEYVRTDNNQNADVTEEQLAADPELWDDYYARVGRIGSTLRVLKEVRWRTYVERYERLSDVDTLEFTRDTFESNLAYSHQF